ncbi:MAG: tRNA 5-methoxyuridine(34)/uridine 5-oxyacetic acid(34) synthase CmoB [Thiofilum sp.]|uniref:tRNA 5-methoxyuridine(34)/uridine 5-oxyacetic acid(34) synthase CmoB n=1 Tax=Thiofilum sp. TaxID=2212733 RepID=UPI0025FE904A|nr:tRNA 5-methoxyuridine(34)/uridine 5-oxyacetic acid(34) synthase CmoB [Thiofilum sp.]MBK8455048.1 tRNA 5-methoxyuridine(34)/uridine 5-oxyacetic acid(34) synthase CmoB [Thiofilum sp.]
MDLQAYFNAVDQALSALPWAEQWRTQLPVQINEVLNAPHGKREEWLQALAQLPPSTPSIVDLNAAAIQMGQAQDLSPEQQVVLRQSLETFIPWRKGPFNLFGTYIDTEWRSDWKWQRVLPHLSDLTGRTILDVGCGSGYHLWRMRGAGAKLVIGIDPSLFFLMQFQCVRHYLPYEPVYYLPLKSEDLPILKEGEGFDTVFSMGVLYHRRSPLQHLLELKGVLRAGGELVLETLVVEGDERTVLMPEDRYGKMRNVWFIPSTALLELWLRRLGFVAIRTVDVGQTSLEEQRRTEWMRFESLADFLDPTDHNKTIEGYPAPKRAVLIAQLPA